jgi:cytochrome c556
MKKFTAYLTTLFAFSLICLSSIAHAQSPAETSIKYRQAVYSVMGYHFGGILVPMVRGEKPYDKEAFARSAGIVAQMAPLAQEGFTPGSDKGTDKTPTKAKPEIWTKAADFKSKMDNMNLEATKLAQLSRTASFDDLKKQFGVTGATCKACHDDYRNK